jgi:hypothetical protein
MHANVQGYGLWGDDTGGQTVASGTTTTILGAGGELAELRAGDEFSLSAGGLITVSTGGLYEIMCQLGMDATNSLGPTTQNSLTLQIQTDDAGGTPVVTTPLDGVSFMWFLNFGLNEHSTLARTMVSITAGHRVYAEYGRTNSTPAFTASTVINKSWIMMRRMGEQSV